MNDSGLGLRVQLVLTALAIVLGSTAALAQHRDSNQPQKTNTSAPSAGQQDKGWLSAAEVPHDSVTSALNTLQALPAQEAAREAIAYRTAREKASDSGKQAADLLTAVALERTNDSAAAVAAHHAVIGEAGNTPYAATARFRLQALEKAALDVAEKWYQKAATEPEAQGWFLSSNQWQWSTTRRAAWQALVDLRGNYLSSRFFAYLRSKSFFPVQLSFLFVLLALTVGAKILSLPFGVKAARFMGQFRRLKPEIENLQAIYGDDLGKMQERLNSLYKERGVNPLSGCAISLLDLIFVIWALYALSSYVPQMALDGARLWWISDVTRFDFGILGVWVACSLLSVLMTTPYQMQSGAQVFFGFIIFSAVIVGIAWYWSWPAYIIIFWVLLTIVGMLTHIALTPIRESDR